MGHTGRDAERCVCVGANLMRDEAGPVDLPSRSDGFVRGLSESIGGPVGEHAVERPGGARSGGAFWTASRIVLALMCLTLALHWVQKSPCQDGAWQEYRQYTRFCYTDVLALYYAEGLNEGKVPYADHPVEYPVLTGAFMGVLGLPVHELGKDRPEINQGQWFYNINALVLGAIGVGAVGALLALRKRRPWDAAMFALSPALLVTATVNWDLLAIGLAVAGMLAWARQRPVLAGVLLGLGCAAKLWPLFVLGPILVLAIRTKRWRAALATIGTSILTVLVVNVPVAIAFPDGWKRFFELNSTRPIDWGTVWYIGRYLDTKWSPNSAGPFQWLSDHISTLNILSYLLFGLACLGIGALALYAPRRPRLAALAFLVVAAFLIFSKVWSQQYVLWLLPLAILARPRWGAFLAWQVAEVLYFLAFYGELLGASGKQVFPEGVFVLAATLRLVGVGAMCYFVIRDILRPEQDPVRATYADDPDGGVFDGAPDPDRGGAITSPPVPVRAG